MNRRELLMGAGAMALTAATAGTALASASHGGDMKYGALIDETLNCIKTGDECLNHCFDTFAAGDTTLAVCAKSIVHMISLCDALVKSASYNSKYTKELTAVCVKAVRDCEAECKKHVKKHKICEISAKACRKCIKECEKVLA